MQSGELVVEVNEKGELVFCARFCKVRSNPIEHTIFWGEDCAARLEFYDRYWIGIRVQMHCPFCAMKTLRISSLGIEREIGLHDFEWATPIACWKCFFKALPKALQKHYPAVDIPFVPLNAAQYVFAKVQREYLLRVALHHATLEAQENEMANLENLLEKLTKAGIPFKPPLC